RRHSLPPPSPVPCALQRRSARSARACRPAHFRARAGDGLLALGALGGGKSGHQTAAAPASRARHCRAHGRRLAALRGGIEADLGVILYLLLHRYLAHCKEDPPGLRVLVGQRIFERVLVTVSWRWARWVEVNLGTRRLQPQLRVLVTVALMAGAWPLFEAGLMP